LRGWCAASSSGEEPYTIAITLLDHLPEAAHGRVRLLASDISTRVLKKASAAVYPLERVAGLPKEMLRKHFERGCGPQEGQARVKAAIRKLVEFRRINLLEGNRFEAPFDFIFCRNVMIYFDKVVQQRVVSMLEKNLAPGGWLFIAHSESLNGMNIRCRTWHRQSLQERRTHDHGKQPGGPCVGATGRTGEEHCMVGISDFRVARDPG
jgi:chemotaxis protein methyltransferase CheR